ncbi:hypothetical protein [Mycobacterium lepromatosis]|uniref:hypothetical protein n=1 Tax=Mycobacterium lepromatosis TaxID=480418 RepID=UPI0005F793EB|nr:hypothetical protein [Mycobacterium lepromatosis]
MFFQVMRGYGGLEVSIGDQAHPLVPRLVPQFAVRVDVVVVGTVADRRGSCYPLHHLRRFAVDEPQHHLS